MSLYGGIVLKGKDKPPAGSPAPPAASASPPASISPAASASPAPADTATEKPKPATWSAALRFAPTVRKKPATPSSRPSAVALKSVFGTADDDSAAAPPPAAAGPRIAAVGKASLVAAPDKAPPPSKWGAVSKPAFEVKPFAGGSVTSDSGTSTPAKPATSARTRTRVRRVIAVPPAMVLEEDLSDVNGFAATAAGKKLAQMEKKKGKKKGRMQRDDPALAFADIPYDPARPCDYSAYKTHVKLVREQRRLEREEQERRRRREGSSGSSYYSEDEEDRDQHDEQPANKKARFFAPPSSYDESPGAGPAFPPPFSYDATSAPPRDESGEDAYARRAALSNAAPPSREETGDEAYQRRVAMSQRREETGEEAYQRRMALSRGEAPPPPAAGPHQSAPPPPPPAFVSSSHPRAPNLAGPQLPPGFVPPPPPPGFVPPPGFAHPHPPPPPSFAPASSSSTLSASAPTFTPPVPSNSASLVPAGESNAALDAAQAKAREIAARLSKLGGAFVAPPAAAGGIGTAPPGFAPAATQAGGAGEAESAEPDSRTFAERMMSKFGWEEGKGLGASESGITAALSVQRTPAASASSNKKAKKKKEQEVAPTPAGMAGRSVVVDVSRDQRIAEQKAQMGGDASRVVLLTNLCGREEVDDDLGGEVAEEANKFGVVERCFVYVVPGETRDDEAVRIFLVMSGLAGGYNAVRNFDGRFFGGRTVRARFYDEKAFNGGRHDL
ncbi:hypothetical protein NBRC10512_004781 [Rhodotorula toruloides]|uniref:RHTO0S03e04786g1_1 n=2 Tax=Rhodotorula toruloides TaxID=5286 RepID=A0A061AKQ6_RHOTO|nr:splicing factor 45 [Rhodotorula toruloides NP11]EMS25818.1 splicing factor 45 [Rhodotorula toruloides NP11]KAJ8295995.1 DNA-damage-repair/toleration protein DRT111, chloroplastic [Rhodotorula toruloides]CDR38160.1 RHTO0S03e04786g1_1 [Rhodotorula toruloides]